MLAWVPTFVGMTAREAGGIHTTDAIPAKAGTHASIHIRDAGRILVRGHKSGRWGPISNVTSERTMSRISQPVPLGRGRTQS
jgi:hypothetical protein